VAAEDWFFSLAPNPVLLPEFMMNTSHLIVAKLELVMINVPSASKLAPSMTFERLVCHQDVAFVICVTLQDVDPILLLAGHHLYSWPESIELGPSSDLGLFLLLVAFSE